MHSSTEGSVSVSYARRQDICLFFLIFLRTDLKTFNKSIGNARLVCVWGGGGGVCQQKIKKIFSSLS